ncbi:restriction endonuclease subunit S [Salinisphaera sp.]|uniref:restriction endonuclease subunit S n=1 Tax=Salinisphaera sp. TaxID=1914330 RepID=UPI000C469C3C|nr:restriction endonuclease subunit S [Salinisphaera sp.]MAS08502.1 hypothetical protein [Salinisphaera sp.]MAS09394.1 hypothetical protein [Salinisphaera sp.]
MTNSLASDWTTATLGDLCYFENGDRGKNYPGRKALTSTGIPFINAGHLNNGQIDWAGMDFIPEEHFHRLGSGKIKRGDILYCLRGSLGKFGLVDRNTEGAIASSLVIVRPTPNIQQRFLAYYFQSELAREMILTFAGGAAQPNLSAKSLKAFEIPLPPLESQKRIVAVLDQAFAALDRAYALVDANLSDTNSLYAAAVEILFEDQSADWARGNLSELVGTVHTGPFGSLLHKSDYIEGGIPLINPANIVDGQIKPNLSKTISYEAAERLAAYKLKAGDLIIGRRGEMGRCAPVKLEMNRWICGTGCFVIRPHNEVLSDFVAYLLRRSNMVKRLTSIATGTTMLNLSNKALSNMPIEMPRIDAQRHILERIDAIQLETRQSSDRYSVRLSHLTQLRQSLLHRAFSGGLA